VIVIRERNILTGNYEVVKSINASLILSTLRKNGALSRSDLTKITNLTSGTVTNIINSLLKLDLVEEIGISDLATGGRKPVLLQLKRDGAYTIVIELTTKGIIASLVDFLGTTIVKEEKNGLFSPEDGTRQILELIDYLLIISNVAKDPIGVGISVPGIVDSDSGKIIDLPQLVGWQNYLLKQELEESLKIPVFIENDANLAALGELWFGKGKDYQNFAYILIEDGVGAGFIINNKLYRGNGRGVGELGHLPITNSNLKCACGNIGCLDTLVAAQGLVATYQERTEKKVSFNDFVSLFVQNDEEALNVVHEAAKYLGLGIGIIINLFHPEAIIIGGKVIELLPEYLTLLKKEVTFNTLPKFHNDLLFLQAEFSRDIKRLGAVALVFQELFQPYSLQ